jgi:hypothetical protein
VRRLAGFGVWAGVGAGLEDGLGVGDVDVRAADGDAVAAGVVDQDWGE